MAMEIEKDQSNKGEGGKERVYKDPKVWASVADKIMTPTTEMGKLWGKPILRKKIL